MKRSVILVLAFVLAVTGMAGCTRQAPSREGEEATPEASATTPTMATVVSPEGGATVVTTGPSPTPVEVGETPPAEATEVEVSPTEPPATEAPTVESTATPPPASAGCRWNHTVQQGEWVWQIARNYGVSPYAILEANGLTIQTANIVLPGKVLCIP
jgi:LysM repeat protein